ncbi:FxsA family protein [Moraxella atlantae]|uniref:Phage T7 F exclusion suppressor FxsA n=1 Tax=Faucicola atlantae TaxID=34059 RepID=A0A378Q512_9GAMM|nr:FxsA family protein [Moraxella atlantae]STY95772.1 phage T7 F exclusion suppressor FxsA [Moraxella atlantae]
MIGNVLGIAIVWFIIEMLVWYLIAQFISGWWVFGWFIVAAVIGVMLIKKGLGTLKPMAAQAQAAMLNPAMRPQENTMVRALALCLAGVLFALPGILSDLVALIVLLPVVQNKAKNAAKDYATKNPEKLMQMMASRMGGMAGMPGMDAAQMQRMQEMMRGGAGGNPFAGMGGFGNSFGGNSPDARPNPTTRARLGRTTIDGQAKTVNRSANDD